MGTFAAVVQMCSGPEVGPNLLRAAELVKQAGDRGASLVVLPENFALMTAAEERKRAAAEALSPGEPGPIVSAMAAAASSAQTYLLLGGMPERGPAGDPAGRIYNSCVLLNPAGGISAVYRKIHLFDVFIPDGATYRESSVVAPGEAPVVARTPFYDLGLSVCYDLRFPELYRALAAKGAGVVAVPAAFTLHTGRDHWHVLLRARAIENQVYVLAAAQNGRHDGNRQTFGHSLIADPWGTVLAEIPDGEGVAIAEIDLERRERIRRELPVLTHRRL